MKKIRSIICIVVIAFLIVACENSSSISDTVFNCFKEKNFSEINSLFCDKSKESHNLEEEFNVAIQFIDGEITTSNPKIVLINSGESIDNGIVTRSDKIYQICDVKTDTGKTYEILFHMYTSNDDESKIGITNILLIDSETNQEIRMGDNLKK